MSRTILIVDDNAIDRTILKGFLKDKYTVIEACSGAEMLSVLGRNENDISVILLDLVMSGIDGFESLQIIRDSAVYRQLPVIVASSHNDEATQARALSLGAIGLASKPYNKDILLPLIENAVSLREISSLSNVLNLDPSSEQEEWHPSDTAVTAARLKTLFDDMNGGVSIVVYEDNGAVRLAYANDRYYNLFGYTKEQFEKELTDPHETVHPDDWGSAFSAIDKVKKTKKAATFRYRIIKHDKSIAYVRCSSSVTSLVGVKGNVLISILTDITESIRFEQQALVSGQRLDAIMKNMNSAVTASIIKNDGTIEILFSNDLHHQMLGYTKEQYLSEVSDPFKPIHPDDLADVRKAVFGLQHGGDEKEMQYRIFTRDGNLKTLRMRISMMTFPDVDEPVQLAIHADVTDIVEAQEKLAAQHEQIAELLNDTPSGIAIVEVNPNDIENTLHTVYYNDRFAGFSGYTKEEYAEILKKREMNFVFDEDTPALVANTVKICRGEIGASADTTIRCHTKDGGFRWLLLTGQLTERRGDICVVNIVLVDVTERQIAVERQRISEEMLRIAAETDQRSMIIYDVKRNTCRAESRTLFSAKYGEVFENIPQSLIDMGLTAPESEDTLRSLFTRIRDGEKNISVSLQLHSESDKYEWFECNTSTIYDAEGQPDHAILVFHNITEQRIKEAVFKKWQQSIDARPSKSYTLFRCNLSKDASLDQQDGELLKVSFPDNALSFNSRTRVYADEYVYPDDREEYAKLLDSDTLLAMFCRGEHFASVDYREIAANGELSWRRVTIETVEYPNSTDVQAFLLYEDIDEMKRTEIEAMELAKADPLTGALNRSAFAQAVDEMIRETPNSHSALIMLDMDGFKHINDTFGYSAGDQALQDVVSVLRTYSRNGDLVCRLGGDKFLVWLRDVPYDAVIVKIVQQICNQLRKAYSQDVLLSASAGIAVYPRDGQGYDELYPNADKALNKVKQAEKGSYAFCSATIDDQTTQLTRALPEVRPFTQSTGSAKRRILIVDDNEVNRITLKGFFKDEYLIEIAKSGTEALVRLRHLGPSISVVLLDLFMPGMDGFAVLRRMQSDVELRTIPVIVVTGDEDHETLLKAFELGAAEYVTKPVDADIIRMRAKAVISKAENERLRAQNSYLMLQRDEEVKYRTVLESTGTAVIEYDWRNHVFLFDSEISKYIAGKFNNRGLWQILLSDMVADSNDVKALQDTLINLGSNRERNRDSKLIRLKTPRGVKHWFRVNYYKRVDDFGLADKLIITFNDVHEEVLANEKLLFQATRDELTGLYNRTGFLEKASELIAAKEPGYYVMACIDVEKFKVINDRYGTEKGDEVLRHIASSIDSFVENNGGICCRYAADKFAVLYPAKLLDTAALAENHRLVSSPACIPRSLRLCVGRCMVNDTTLPVSALFDRAAMAEALAKGRYDVYIIDYDESMRDSILKEQQIAGDMVEALNNGEFEPWFQPQYNHSTGALIGAEALVRWRKDGRIIPPYDFIPIFEKNGFIYEVDQYIWRSVCVLLRRWLDEGRNPLPISVNISRHDMFQENFIDVITGLVAEYQLPVELLRLEITESAFSADTATITNIAGMLIDAGFTVEIDDFGSGYSSLNTLKDVPASILKLDMRFFERSGDAKRGGNIVESVVRMAKWLGMAVIAEGVEDKAQADYLKSIGCVYIQGYLYAKPLPVDEYEKRLDAGEKEAQLTRLKTLQNLDNNDFWDSRSMDTLIFNSYVGAACILEYHNGKVEMLRATDHYAHMLSGGTLDIQDVLAIDWIAHMDERNIRLFTDAVLESIKTKDTVVRELEFHGLSGCPETVIFRSSLRVIATMGERQLIYCLNDNMTAQRAAEREVLNASERVKAVIENINGGISAVYLKNDKPEYVLANEQYYKILGYTREEFELDPPNPFDLLHPDDRESVRRKFIESHDKWAHYTMEYRMIRRDGAVRHILCNTSVVHLPGIDEPVQLAVTNDITELREMQSKELAIRDRLNTVMNTVSNAITAVAFRDDGLEFLFANNRFYEMYGIHRGDIGADHLSAALDLILPKHRDAVRNAIREAVKTMKTASVEFQIQRPDGTVRWIHVTLNITMLADINAPVLVAVLSDISNEKEASEQLRFLNDSARDILAQPDSERAINDTLKKMLTFFAGERSYIFELHDATQTSDNTFEVCAPGVTAEIQRLQGVPYDTQQYWFDAFHKTGFVVIPDVAAINESERAMRDILLMQNIRSIIVAPLWRDGKLIGYTGIDNPTVAVDQVSQLIALADYLAVLLTRRDLMRKIKHDNETVRLLMDDTPGGFLRMRILPDNTPVIVSLNEGFARLLGMTSDEVMAEYGDDAYKFVVDEDCSAIRNAAVQALAGSGTYICKCRLKKKDGTSIWVQVFGRFVKDENGELFRNSHFTDITEELATEEHQKTLLDNLPFGAAMCEFDGERLTVIHMNKQYWKLIGSKPATYINASVLDAIHPEDRTVTIQEIQAAIRQERSAAADIRILNGEGVFSPFHVTASIVPLQDGRYQLFVAYSPISDKEVSLQEMLPIAMSTIVSSSEDMSYVKDKDLRYICVSPSIAKMAGVESPRDLVGKNTEEVFGEEFTERFNTDDRHVIETGEAMIRTLEHIPEADGSVRMVRTSKYPILSASGHAIGLYCVSQDITAQKERESQLELLTDTIPGGIASYSISKAGYQALYFNDGFFAYSGYTREEYTELTKKEPLALMFPEDRDKFRAVLYTFGTQRQDGMTGSCDYRCYTKDGQTRYMSLKAALTQLDAEHYILNVVQFDMTRHMEMEQRIINLLDNLPFGAAMYEFDGKGLKALHINKQYQTLVGRTQNSSNLEGFTPTDFIHPDDWCIVLTSIKDAIAYNRDGSCNIRLLYGKDEYRSFHIDARIIPQPEGKYLVYAAYTRLSEQELTFENALPHMFATVMESSTDLSFAKDINFRYICCSRTFATLLGLESEKEVVGKTDYELFPKEIADMFRRDDSVLFATHKPQIDVQEMLPSPDGTKHYIRTSKHLMRSDTDTIIGIYCIGRDVTEIREAYAQLRLLTDSIPGGIATFRCSPGNIETIYFNDGICELAGYSREEYNAHPIPMLDLVFDEDRPIIREQIELMQNGVKHLNFTVRIHTKNGGYKWISDVATVTDNIGDVYIINAVLTDVTEQYEEKERLRLAEEEYRIATEHSGHTIGRYDIASQTLIISGDAAVKLALPESIPDVPYGRVKLGKISKATTKDYIAFYEKIMHGEKECSVTFQELLTIGWRWITVRATTILDDNGRPVSAIISYMDVTEQQEKEAVYMKWQQNLIQKGPKSYTLYRCNLNEDASYDSVEGELLNVHESWDEAKAKTLNERARDFARHYVVAEDRDMYLRFVNADTMLASYYRGKRSASIEFRGLITSGEIHWIRLSVELVEYPNTKDISAYLMYEDINDSKLMAIKTQTMAETDPLTGILNRKTFIARMDEMLAMRRGNALYALLLLDVDGFKLINDSFGHGVGDQVLIDTARAIQSVLRDSDLVCRMGGDEFLVCLSAVPSKDIILKKAKQILALMHGVAKLEVKLSVSAGIAICPDDGSTFETLYPKVDKALYHVKSHGKDNCAFYDANMKAALISTDEHFITPIDPAMKPTVLIIDSHEANRKLMAGIFAADFNMEAVADGASALDYLRHNVKDVAAILLELTLSDMDGFAVLEHIRKLELSANMPVIVVSEAGERDAALCAIKAGASDFVTKPIDPTLLRIRVESAIAKAENERLHAQIRSLALLISQEKQ